MFRPRLTAKSYMILFLAFLVILAGRQGGDYGVLFLPVSTSLLTAVIADLIIDYFKSRKFKVSSSAVITGLIIALVMSPRQNPAYYILASLLAILSKHFLRIAKRQIFNPAGFGLLATAIIFPVTLSWAGQVNNWFIIAVGAFVVYQIKRFPVLIGYLLAMAMLLIGYALVNHAGIFDYLPVINLFFVFVMLIEPMTSPLESLQGWLFGIIVALAGFIFYLYLPQFDFAISGLLIGNLSNLFLRRLKKR